MNMSKIFAAILPVLLLAPLAQSAERVIWDSTGVSGFPPSIIYSYKYGTGFTAQIDTAEIDDKPYYMGGIVSAKSASSNGGAGFGFSWNSTEDPEDYSLTPRKTDLSAYGGVCLTYYATNVFRMDFRQSLIASDDGGDDNFFGILLPSTNGATVNKFVPMDTSVIKMGWNGENKWKFNKKNQLGLQFSYKKEQLSKYGLESEIYIYALRLADECPQHAPEVLSTFKTEYRIKEGEKLTLRMSDIFTDADGDELTISGTGVGEGVVRSYDDTQVFTLKDSIEFTTVKNPAEEDSLVFTLTAVDPSGRKATCVVGIKPEDVKNVPVIRDTTFEVFQGKSVKLPAKFTFYPDDDAIEDMKFLSYDLDGDRFNLFVDEERLPEDGTFEFDSELGRFSYTAPDPPFTGEVYFYLYAVEQKDENSISDTTKITIKVLDINDPPELEIANDTTFDYYLDLEGDPDVGVFNDSSLYIPMKEDFEDTIWVRINSNDLVFTDVDTPELEYGVKTNGIVNAELASKGRATYVKIYAKKDANGMAKVTYYADDGEFQVGVDIYVNVVAVADLPVAAADEYNAVQGVKLSVKAKDGLLANDENADDPEAELLASVVDEPEHGTLTLKEDGSFTYKSDEDFRGDDSFTYIVTNPDDVESEPGTVTIHVAGQNMAPVVVDGIVDSLNKLLSTFTEDKVTSIKIFTMAEISGWFEDPDGDDLTFDAKSGDGKMKVAVSEKNVKISPLPDSSGTAVIIVTATDSAGLSVDLELTATIKPVNDKPVVTPQEDLVFEVALEDWNMEFDLDSLVTDIDGDTLTFAIAKSCLLMKEFFKMEIDEDNVLKISPQKKGLEPGTDYLLTIVASDAEYDVNLIITFHSKGEKKKKEDAIRSIAQQPKATWQNAVQASRGTVAIMDLQGRVMWNAQLPVSEADVRNASAKVQGRKVLRVNSQTWTIK